MTLMTFILLGLANWRLASMTANEPGPFGMFEKARRHAARLNRRHRFWCRFKLYKGVTCEWCNSVWFGALLTVLYQPADLLTWVTLPFALSAFTILFKYTLQAVKQVDEHLERLKKADQPAQTEAYRPVQMPEHYYFDPYTGKVMD
jgi:hypothetical protein